MDEPFGALDPFTRAGLQDHLLELWTGRRPTLVIVTHDAEEAALLADRVVVMQPRPGRIEAIVRVDAPRPRDRQSAEVGAVKRQLVELLTGTFASAGALSSRASRRRAMPRPIPRYEKEPAMNSADLRNLQAPLKAKYKDDPDAAVITLKAKGMLDDAHVACKVETGRALAVAGLHPATGGTGLELCSGDMLLEALVACAGVTLKAVATALGIPLRAAGLRRRRPRFPRHARCRPRGARRLPRHPPEFRLDADARRTSSTACSS